MSYVVFFLFAIFGISCTQSSPTIVIDVSLVELDLEEFNNHVNKPPELDIDDVLKMRVSVEVTNIRNLKAIDIDIPHLVDYVDRYDRIRSLSGGGDYKSAYVVFDRKGLSNNDIRALFKDAIITITWIINDEEEIFKHIISDYMP